MSVGGHWGEKNPYLIGGMQINTVIVDLNLKIYQKFDIAILLLAIYPKNYILYCI